MLNEGLDVLNLFDKFVYMIQGKVNQVERYEVIPLKKHSLSEEVQGTACLL